MDIAENYGFFEKVTVVTFPKSQELMNKPWFHECALINDEKGISIFGMQAFVVPVRLLKQ